MTKHLSTCSLIKTPGWCSWLGQSLMFTTGYLWQCWYLLISSIYHAVHHVVYTQVLTPCPMVHSQILTPCIMLYIQMFTLCYMWCAHRYTVCPTPPGLPGTVWEGDDGQLPASGEIWVHGLHAAQIHQTAETVSLTVQLPCFTLLMMYSDTGKLSAWPHNSFALHCRWFTGYW